MGECPGVVARTKTFSRTVAQVKELDPDAVCEVALVGRIAAGAPMDAIEDIEMICVPRFMLGRVRPERIHALRVKGDSMIDEHICDGDMSQC